MILELFLLALAAGSALAVGFAYTQAVGYEKDYGDLRMLRAQLRGTDEEIKRRVTGLMRVGLFSFAEKKQLFRVLTEEDVQWLPVRPPIGLTSVVSSHVIPLMTKSNYSIESQEPGYRGTLY